MKDDLQEIINSMKGIKYSLVDKNVTTDDITNILVEVGNFIKEQQSRGYAVYFKDIGLFTLFREKILVSHHPIKYIMSQKPVFQLSHSLASKFRIKWARQIAETKLPQKLLNPSTIAIKSGVDRAKVIFCLNELVAVIEKSLSENKSVRVPFCGVGTLKIDEDEWRMEFDREYLNTVTINDVLHVMEEM